MESLFGGRALHLRSPQATALGWWPPSPWRWQGRAGGQGVVDSGCWLSLDIECVVPGHPQRSLENLFLKMCDNGLQGVELCVFSPSDATVRKGNLAAFVGERCKADIPAGSAIPPPCQSHLLINLISSSIPPPRQPHLLMSPHESPTHGHSPL